MNFYSHCYKGNQFINKFKYILFFMGSLQLMYLYTINNEVNYDFK